MVVNFGRVASLLYCFRPSEILSIFMITYCDLSFHDLRISSLSKKKRTSAFTSYKTLSIIVLVYYSFAF